MFSKQPVEHCLHLARWMGATLPLLCLCWDSRTTSWCRQDPAASYGLITVESYERYHACMQLHFMYPHHCWILPTRADHQLFHPILYIFVPKSIYTCTRYLSHCLFLGHWQRWLWTWVVSPTGRTPKGNALCEKQEIMHLIYSCFGFRAVVLLRQMNWIQVLM